MKRKIRKFLNSYDGLLNDFSMRFLFDRFKENHSESKRRENGNFTVKIQKRIKTNS